LWILPGWSKRKEEEITMTLAQLIRLFEGIAKEQPSINMIVQNDVFRINSAPSLKYGVFAWTQGQHSGNINGMQTYSFSLFYVDRLKEDLSNQIEIQSVGCETIGNILRMLNEHDVEVGSYTMQTFNQRFTDECAGVYCNVTLSVLPTSRCVEEYSEHDNILIY
jgi:hypothetical protein